MHVIARKTMVSFYSRPNRQDARGPLEAWFHEAKQAQWETPADIKVQFRSASILKGNRVVFNIAGNKYRLIVKINYVTKTVFVRFIGTHQEYDKIDPEVV